MRVWFCGARRLPPRWLTAAAVGLFLAFSVVSAPHLVHHLGEHSKQTDPCPVSILLQTLSGLLPPIPDLPLQLATAWILIAGTLPLLPLTYTLSYHPRAPPAPVSPPVSR